MKRGIKTLGLMALFFSVTLPGLAEAAKPLWVLVLTGENNHDWRATTPVLKKALEATRRFTVGVVTNVAAMKPDAFAPYGAVLNNFNTFGRQK